ncbi:MAG: hypothetical protein HUJ61_00105, partial [Bacilli bacterium]|nr:hypothetical protein [Bacilli bacterium]
MKKLVHFVIFIIILVCLSSCNANFEDKIHSWDDGTIVKKSTCCSHGQIMYKCQFCEGTKVNELPVSTEHNYTKFIYSSSLG